MWLPSHLMSTLMQLQSGDATLPLSPLGTKEEEREHQRCPRSSRVVNTSSSWWFWNSCCRPQGMSGYWCSGNWDKDLKLWGKRPKTKAGARERSHAHLWSACIGSGEHLWCMCPDFVLHFMKKQKDLLPFRYVHLNIYVRNTIITRIFFKINGMGRQREPAHLTGI